METSQAVEAVEKAVFEEACQLIRRTYGSGDRDMIYVGVHAGPAHMTLCASDDGLMIDRIDVDEDFRRQGWGRRAVEAVFAAIRETVGEWDVYLFAEPQAEAFWEAMGFADWVCDGEHRPMRRAVR